MKVLIFIMLILIFSCNKYEDDLIKDNIAENIILNKVKIYQYHKKDVTDFSFLSKYKNLRALDLSGTNVKDISFLKELTKINTLLLINTKVKDITPVKYLTKLHQLFINRTLVKDLTPLKNLKELSIIKTDNKDIISAGLKVYLEPDYSNLIIYNKKNKYPEELDKYPELSFSLYQKFKKVEYIDFSNIELEDISGALQFKELKVLKINLKKCNCSIVKNDLSELRNLEQIYIYGDVENHNPYKNFSGINIIFPKSLKNLYLYNIKIDKYEFILNKKFEKLFTLGFPFDRDIRILNFTKNKKYIKNIFNKIIIKNRFFTPYNCNIVDLSKNFEFRGINLYTSNCDVVNDLRNNIINFKMYLALDDYEFFIYKINVNINHLWKNNITFLDKAIADKNQEAIKYLKENGAKRGYKLTKKDCKDIKLIESKINTFGLMN